MLYSFGGSGTIGFFAATVRRSLFLLECFLMKTVMLQIAAAADALASQARAVAEGEAITDDALAVVRRAFLTLNAACKPLKRSRRK